MVIANLAPIIAINSLLAVMYLNTKEGGFIGIWLKSEIPKVNIQIEVYKSLSIRFTRPSVTFLTYVIFLFLLVGPFVTFIF